MGLGCTLDSGEKVASRSALNNSSTSYFAMEVILMQYGLVCLAVCRVKSVPLQWEDQIQEQDCLRNRECAFGRRMLEIHLPGSACEPALVGL